MLLSLAAFLEENREIIVNAAKISIANARSEERKKERKKKNKH